jgi:hypothetical protein
MDPTVATKSRDQARFPAVDGVPAGNENYLFFCLPYFRLELHNSMTLPEGGHLHPSQPLFQTHYPSIGKQRDLQQVICNLQGIPENHCFHVSALWCLLIPDSMCQVSWWIDVSLSLILMSEYILTCAKSLSVVDILTDSITIQHSPAPKTLSIGSYTLPSTLQVEYDTRLWLFSIDQCDTWFVSLNVFGKKVWERSHPDIRPEIYTSTFW